MKQKLLFWHFVYIFIEYTENSENFIVVLFSLFWAKLWNLTIFCIKSKENQSQPLSAIYNVECAAVRHAKGLVFEYRSRHTWVVTGRDSSTMPIERSATGVEDTGSWRWPLKNPDVPCWCGTYANEHRACPSMTKATSPYEWKFSRRMKHKIQTNVDHR